MDDGDLNVVAVLSGNRNFEGRIHPQVRASYLASPPLCVAYALAGSVQIDLTTEPLGRGADGPVFLSDIWPSPEEVAETIRTSTDRGQFETEYGRIWDGDEHWASLPSPVGPMYDWDPASTYVQEPPFFEGLDDAVVGGNIEGARVLVKVGDSLTTDHISPAGSIKADSPAGEYLKANGVEPAAFNSYGARRGNHEVMMRGTFANVRIRNRDGRPARRGAWTLVSSPAGERHERVRRRRAVTGRPGVPLAVHRGPGVRHRKFQPGLGGEGSRAATLGVRVVVARELRADPSQQPRRDGHPAVAVRGGGVRGVARPHRPGDVLGPRPAERRVARHAGRGRSGERGRLGPHVQPRPCGSTAPRRWRTSPAAASCGWCCGSCSER